MITERRQVDAGAHDRPESRGGDDGSQCAALQQCRRWSVQSESTEVDDHVEIDLTEPIESFGQVFPNPTEMRCTTRLGETWQEEPAAILLGRQGQRLVENRLSKWATIAMCLGYP